MEKLIEEIRWLEKLSDGIRELKPEEFNYNHYVSKYVHEEDLCGTICCAYGWMPRLVPEANVKWEYGIHDPYGSVTMSKYPSDTFKEISKEFIDVSLITPHVITGKTLINFMFYGGKICHTPEHKQHHMNEFAKMRGYTYLKEHSFNSIFGTANGESCPYNAQRIANRIDYSVYLLKSLVKDYKIEENITSNIKKSWWEKLKTLFISK